MSMLPPEVRECDLLKERVRELEERCAELKVMLGDALDREAVLKAERAALRAELDERGRLT